MKAHSTLVGRVRSEQGMMTLLGVMFLLLILSAAGSALVVSGRTEVAVSRNHEVSAQSEAAAEAGLNHAVDASINYLLRWRINGFAAPRDASATLLLGPDVAIGTPDDGTLEVITAGAIPRVPNRVNLLDPTTGALRAQYDARVCDEDDPIRGLGLTAADLARIGENDGNPAADANLEIIVRATGYSPDGTTTPLEATIGSVTLPALVSDGDLRVQGNPCVLGSNGSVHSNADLQVGGNACVATDATASGGYTEVGNPTIGGQTGGGESNVDLPPVQASDYLNAADIVLKSDGRMLTNPGGVLICDDAAVPGSCEAAGYMWEFNGGVNEWSVADNSMGANGDNHTWYAETNVHLGTTVGTPPDPLNITIIAEGNIRLDGNGVIEANTPGLLFVTDQDLMWTGGKDQVGAEAQILVREQAFFAGNGSIIGQIVIQDAAAVSNLVTTSRVQGDFTITNNGALEGLMFAVTGWRRG